MPTINTLLTTIRQTASQDVRISGPSAIGGLARVQGSKNAANKLIAATVALPGRYEIHNFPLILDPLEVLSIVEWLGGSVRVKPGNVVAVDTTRVANKPIPFALTKTTTGAFGLAGALLGRFGTVAIGKPGGDAIGPRPIDLHADGWRALGAQISEEPETIQGELGSRPANARFTMRMPSTGAAVNFILTVAGAGGTAVLDNAPAKDGDVEAMYALLRAVGVEVRSRSGRVQVDARNFRTRGDPTVFTCPADRNDAFTWLAYGALSRNGLRIAGLSLDDVQAGVDVLRSIGVSCGPMAGNELLVKAPPRDFRLLERLTIVAGPAGGFHSDWAPLLEVLLATIPGRYRIIDTLFSNRVRQAELLQAMGATVRIGGGLPPARVHLHFGGDPSAARYIIDMQGGRHLHSLTAEVGYDVRACAAAVMAASQATGVSVLSGIGALYRGYENIAGRLQAIGVNLSGA